MPLELIGRGAWFLSWEDGQLMLSACLWLAGQGAKDLMWIDTNDAADVCPWSACRLMWHACCIVHVEIA